MPSLEFKGKQFVHSHHLGVPFRELRVDASKSLPGKGKKASLDDNLIIHGDNLEALKALLPTHAGKVDCIFIDPPYNTGNEGWCYNDNVRSPLMKEWLKKSANPVDKEDLERHDKWLCMMWPRLNLLHELLAEDGVLFVTIDDNEQHRLRDILDEVFQHESAFYAHIAWQKKYATSNDAKGFSAMFDHVLVYRKSGSFARGLLARTSKNDSNYRHEDEDGVFRVSDYTCNKTSEERSNLYYQVINPNTGEKTFPKKTRVWAYSQEEHERNIKKNLVWWGADGLSKVPGFKRYRHALRGGGGTVPSTWWPHEFAGHTDEAKKEIQAVLGDIEVKFETPKPVRLLSKILEIATDENSIILDSFSGSGTTAHAVLEANRNDGGNRRFILVECEDYADTLTAERVRRVINGYSFTGTQRDQLLTENVTWTLFNKKHQETLDRISSIENLQGADYDAIKKEIKDGVLTVTGEKKVKGKTDGLGGSFTYCTLGEPIDIESLLTGKGLPSWESLARYVFYTATGRSLEKVAKPGADGFVGETDLFRVHLFYQPDTEWLRSNEAALDATRMQAVVKTNKSGKRAIVFAVAKFMSQKDLTDKRIEFCQLPYAIHRILGD
jgi:adenine-specific DNA-methyltransferase